MKIPWIPFQALALGLASLLCPGCGRGADPTPTPAETPSLAANSLPQPPPDPPSGNLIAKTVGDFDEGTFRRLGLSVKGSFTFGGSRFYRLHTSGTVGEALAVLTACGGVTYAEPDVQIRMHGTPDLDRLGPLVEGEEYSIYLTRLKEAWSTYGFGPATPMVVDIDTGIAWTHQDFLRGGRSVVKHAYSWWDLSTQPPLEIMPSATPDLQPLDYLGSAVTSTCPSDSPEDAHGCHTAGIMAAQGAQGHGVLGVCWNADLVSYKALLQGGGDLWTIYGSLYHLLAWKKASRYAHTIPVNMSLGGPGASAFALEVVEACIENNIVIVASAGNSGQNMPEYPAAFPGVIAVGATTGHDRKTTFSTGGPHLSLCAPGLDIISCGNASDQAHMSMSGTSMSAPFITGLVGYMLTWNPDLTPAQIKTYLERNADLIEGATGFTEATGWGRVNCLRTIGAVVKDLRAGTTPPSDYLGQPLRVTVRDTSRGAPTPMAGVPVYLYRCTTDGDILGFVACGITGEDAGDNQLLLAAGTVDFNLLRPGTYLVRTLLKGLGAGSAPITLDMATRNPALTVDYASPRYFFQVLPSQADAENAAGDALLFVSDHATGRFLEILPSGARDRKGILVAPDQELDLNVRPHLLHKGEYALWVGTAPFPGEAAPGSLANPGEGALRGSLAHDALSAQEVPLDNFTYGLSSFATDWYRLPPPGGHPKEGVME